MTNNKPNNIDDYIANFPQETQEVLQQMRATIHKVAPGVEEKISYGMPTFNLNKHYLVYFAGYKNHVGLYPAPIGVDEFKEDMKPYKTGKGSIQFPLDRPMPWNLISRIIEYRIDENLKKEKK